MCPTNSPGYRNKRGSDGKTNYEKYHGTSKELKRRAGRNAARRIMGLAKGDRKEVDHKNSNATDNSKKNLRIISRTTNRKLGAKKANK